MHRQQPLGLANLVGGLFFFAMCGAFALVMLAVLLWAVGAVAG
jgi:hypothetical protein